MTTYGSTPSVASAGGDPPSFSSFVAAVKVTMDKTGSDPSSSVFSSLRDTMPGGSGSPPAHGANKALHLSGSDSLSGGDGPKHSFSTDGIKTALDQGGKFTVHASMTASDSIFGGTAHEVVHIKETFTGVPHGSSTDHVTTITFSGGQTSQAESVKVVFNDHPKPH